jgi:hypothetical protein
MKKLLAVVTVVALAGVVLAEPPKSGPQVGQKVPGPFRPLHATGPDTGEKVCLYCKNGPNPVAMVFAREVTPAVVSLIKKIDAATVVHQDVKMGSFVVFLNDEEGLAAQLKQLAAREKISEMILSVDSPTGPPSYKVAKDADVTVVLYTHHTVRANHAFRRGELDEKAIAAVVADIAKILPGE